MKNIVTRNDDTEYARYGFEIFWPGLVQFEGLTPEAYAARLEVRSRQVTDMMRHIQEDFYMAPKKRGGLELTRIDPDPPPSVDDPEHMTWRRSRLSDPALRFIGAYELSRDVASEADGGMAGMLVLEQDPKEPEAIEIVELDVRHGYRLTGVADTLLRIGLDLVPPDTIVELTVAETNLRAQRFYYNRGFVYDQAAEGGLLAEAHGVFDTEHLAMSATVDGVQERLHKIYLQTRPELLQYSVQLPESAAARYYQ